MKILITLALLLACVSARAAELYEITLTWDAPLKRTDDTALPPAEIKNYVIEHTVNGAGSKMTTVLPAMRSFVFPDMPTGLYAFRISVVDIYGVSSGWSEVYPAALRASPSAPATKTITWRCKSGCTN